MLKDEIEKKKKKGVILMFLLIISMFVDIVKLSLDP